VVGVVPVQSEFVENTDDLLAAGKSVSRRAARREGRHHPHALGHSMAAAATNMIRVHTVS